MTNTNKSIGNTTNTNNTNIWEVFGCPDWYFCTNDKYQSEHPKTSKTLVLLVFLVFWRFLLVFVTLDWYLLVFLHVLLYFARKLMICYGFCKCWQEIDGFALVLLGFDSGAAGRLVGCPKIPIMRSKDFQNIDIFSIFWYFEGFDWYLSVGIGIYWYSCTFSIILLENHWFVVVFQRLGTKSMNLFVFVCVFIGFRSGAAMGLTGWCQNTNQNIQRLPKHLYYLYFQIHSTYQILHSAY